MLEILQELSGDLGTGRVGWSPEPKTLQRGKGEANEYIKGDKKELSYKAGEKTDEGLLS